MKYKITEVMPMWSDYTTTIFMVGEGMRKIDFKNGIARTSEECVADHFRKNPLRYRVETE